MLSTFSRILVAACTLAAWPATADEPPAALVADLVIASRVPDVNPEPVAQIDDRLYFLATTSTTGRELFRTDGTPAGTELVADLCKGRCSAFFYAVSAVAVLDGTLYLPACDARGCGLWKLSDDGPVAIYDGGGSPYFAASFIISNTRIERFSKCLATRRATRRAAL